MDDKKKTLIREIEHWRRSKLLPEQYCDFLLNLYLEDGREKPAQAAWFGLNTMNIRNSNWKNWLLIFGILSLLCIAALNFNAFDLPMQIGTSILFLACLYGWSGVKREKEPPAALVLLGMASLFLLFIGVYLMKMHGLEDSVPVVAYVVLVSVVWIMTGLVARFALFHLCGWVSLVFCYGWLLHHQLATIQWVTLELSWVPLAIVFCWMSWMVHEKSRQTGFVFFAVGLIVWYMPEMYGMLYSEQYGEMTVQWLLLGKIVIEAALLFFFRKKWTEWVVF
ncbi:hypothetical protein ACFQI7_05895 [Paenibacillus allorhizosphaerae]|uniref:DUF2157 domain-containing protein n=1 Tax=Paenibacillus allorhizosphaerae TaxID=2849866 RepID=A0ABN7TBT8_9BACL|nr:hypothetical protein [Paenibacillus allorhizosphaerae]CAG7620146.1 hypothetical protein PAECIP111802_00647 [Paenibacillus allorhizosphaerae]